MTTEPRHLHSLLAFLDPLLGGASLVVESHQRPAVRLRVGDDEPHAGEQFHSGELFPRVGFEEQNCPFRGLRKHLALQTRLTIAFSDGQVYPIGRAESP